MPYPNSYDNLAAGNPSPTSPRTSPSLAGEVSDANTAVDAIQAELGLEPSGDYPTVRQRLEGIESDLASGIPSGVVQMFAGSSVPTGWLVCDGSAVSRTTYASLFAAIGTTYGAGNGSSTFNLPNFMGQAIPAGPTSGSSGRGAGTKTTSSPSAPASGPASPAQTGEVGAHTHGMTHTHGIDHNHTLSGQTANHDHQYKLMTGGNAPTYPNTNPANQNHTHNIKTTSPTTSGGASSSNTGPSNAHSHTHEHTHTISHTHTVPIVGLLFMIKV